MTAKKTGSRTSSTTGGRSTFTKAEQAAMKERSLEVKAEGRGRRQEEAESAVLAKIAEMPSSDRTMATRLHKVITKTAPDLEPKLWYGMPAYARDGKVVCFFQAADKFKARYATFGFNDTAKLDQGDMWATAFALKKLTSAGEAKIAQLVKKAAS